MKLLLLSLTTSLVLFIPLKPASALPLPYKLDATGLVQHSRFAGTRPQPGVNFDGIVALDDCSGSVVRFTQSKPSDLAMVLTNGHCVESGFPSPATFISHQASERAFTLLSPEGEKIGDVSAREIVYSSMTKTDMTLYLLDLTFQDLETRYSVHALTVSSDHPVIGTKIKVISGYWLKEYNCQVETFIPHLKEGDWTWDDSVRYSRPGCEVIGGTSGSPVLDADTRSVIAINNTTNESGEKCTFDNPCEVDSHGETSFHKGYSYGQETYWLTTCLNEQNQLDLSTPDCQLFH